jgi:uncharacterized protein YuzE
MKLTVDKEADILSIRLRENGHTEESEEVQPGVIVDYDAQGEVVGVEILHVSHRVGPPSALVEALHHIASVPSTPESAARIAREALARIGQA